MYIKESKQIPFNKLRISPFNVRKTGILTQKEYEKTISHTEDISQDYRKLKPSILEMGGITEMLVVIEKKGFYEIIQGQRRYLAFKELYEEGKLTSDLMWCCVKVLSNPKNEEAEIATEELVDANTKMALGDNYRDAFQTVLHHYKDLDKVARIFGISREQAEGQYVHYDVLNAPASTEKTQTQKQQSTISHDGIQVRRNLSHEELQYFIRWKRENPNLSETDIESKVQHWFKETGDLHGRVKTVLIHALADYANSEKISLQTALERFLYDDLKRFLREKRFYADQEGD